MEARAMISTDMILPRRRTRVQPLIRYRKQGARLLLGCGILLHLLFLISLKAGWLNFLFNDAMHRFGPGCDFFSIYAAGVRARHSEPVYAFGDHVASVPYAYAFRYAPLVAYTLGLGLSLMPPAIAYGVWLVLCEWALLRNIRLTFQYAPNRRIGYIACALWLLFTPYYLELYVGQFTFLTASLMFWAYLGWQEASEPNSGSSARTAGGRGDLAFAVAVWLKMMPLLFLPLALMQKRWRGALVTLAVLVGTAWLYFQRFPADWTVFVQTNFDPFPSWHAGNHGLMAFLYESAGRNTQPYLLMRGSVLALVTSALLYLIFRTATAAQKIAHNKVGEAGNVVAGVPPLLGLYAALSAAYLLIYKDVWEHHYVLLLPPLVLLVLARQPARLWLPSFIIGALPGLFALYDVTGLGYNEDPQHYWNHAVSLLHHGWKPLAPLWLFSGILLSVLRSERKVEAARTRLARQWHIASTVPGVGRGGLALARISLIALCVVGAVGATRWAQAAIHAQNQAALTLVWPDTVFSKQQRRETCGPAALATICRHYGVSANEEELARLAGTTAQGTTMLGLQRAAQAKGLVAEGWWVTTNSLPRLPCPCLLFFDQGHFAVLTGVRDNRFFVADPTLGQRVWSANELSSFWSGATLVIGPADSTRSSANLPIQERR